MEPESTSQLETILTQNWTHSRHCEAQMYWFTSIFAAILTAVLVFIGEKNSNSGLSLVLALFGLILSVVGFFIIVALSLGHQNYIMNVVVILKCWKKSEFYRDWEKPVHYKDWHRLFFEITITLFAVLCLHFGYHPDAASLSRSIWLAIASIAIFIHIEMLFRLKWKKEFDYRNEVIKILFPTFKRKIVNPNQEASDIEKEIENLCNSK